MKFNESKFFISVFFGCVVLLAACSGEDGDPGPQGDQGLQGDQGTKGAISNSGYQKSGYLQGTVMGTRKDGTAFNEPFKYEYTADSLQAFSLQSGVKNITVSRSLNSFADSYMNLSLKSEGGILTPSSVSSGYFNFIKQLDSETMFRISARPYFLATEAFVRTLSLEQNQVYRFGTTGSYGEIFNYETSYKGNEDAYQFYAYLSTENYSVYYSMVDGSLLGLRKNSDGSYLEDGELFNLYNKIEFLENTDHGKMVFYDILTEEGLFEAIPAVAADALTITNYVHDATTGVLSFNFVLTISGHISDYNRENSTTHDLTLTGSYNSGGKVYKNIVGRQGN